MEGLIGKIILPYLFKEKIIDPEQLMSSTDFHLDALISKIVDEGYALSAARIKVFSSAEEAKEAESALKQSGVKITFIEEFKQKTSTGTKYLVRLDANGEPKSFAEACPEKAKELEDIMRPTHPYRLYYLGKTFEVSEGLEKAVRATS